MDFSDLRRLPKIVAMYRVKNGGRWIEKSIESILGLCSEIVVFDDGSTDNTIEICQSFKEVVDIQHQSDLSFDEKRDRNRLLKMALQRKPDYLFTIDADEILLPNTEKIILEELNALYPDTDIFQFQFLTVWDKLNMYRYDGTTSNTWHNRLFRMKNQPKDLSFKDTGYYGNLHCGGIPHNAIGLEQAVRSKAKILHYSVYDAETRYKKYLYYNSVDPESEKQDRYRNIISGDSKFAGPNGMEFRIMPEGMYYTI